MIFPQVKCHFLYFVLIPGKKVSGPGKIVFELKELIIPHVYSPCFAFVLGDLVLAPGEMILGLGEKEYNFGKITPEPFS